MKVWLEDILWLLAFCGVVGLVWLYFPAQG